MKKILFIIVVIGFQSVFGQVKNRSFEKVDSLMIDSPKPIIVFLHTDWCNICKLMENTTLKNETVVNKLNSDFYFISFNPEKNKSVTFHNKTFKFVPNGRNNGINELANELGKINGAITYPTICILNENYEIVFQYNKLLNIEEFLAILNNIN